MTNLEMSEETPDEAQLLDDEAQRNLMWGITNAGVIQSVHAYLTWHSGSGLRHALQSPSERAQFIDSRVDEAHKHAMAHGVDLNDTRRIRSLMSLDSQTEHEPGDSPVCYLDVQLIEHGYALPFTQPTEFSLEPLNIGYSRYRDYDEFKKAYRDLGYYIQFYPGEVDYHLMRLQKEYLSVSNYVFIQDVDAFHFIPPEWRILGAPCQRDRKISQLNMAYDVGQLINIRGQIIEVSQPKTTFTDIAWKCKDTNCGQIHFVEQDSLLNTVAKPEPTCGKYTEMQSGESNGCNSKHFIRLPPPMSNAIALQRLTLQEEEIEGGEARTIKLEIRGSLVESVLAGQGLEITGILMTEPMTKGSLLEDKFVLVRSVTERSDLFSQITITQTDREEIEAFNGDFTLEERMAQIIEWWAGRIYAEEHIKAAIILQACGGSHNHYSDTGGNLHLLLVGDPGTAKTKLLELAGKLHPQSRFVNAESATQAGLTAACQQVEDMYTGKKQWALVPGALALTHPEAICAVDELNLYKGDFGDFNNALESGEVYVNKVVKGRVMTRCSVICGANPDNGNKKKWIRGEQVSYAEQIALDFTLLQRFGAIFILEDIPDYGRDLNIAKAMTKGITEGEQLNDGINKLDFIQKYLALARELNPKLTPAAQNYITEGHARKRSENTGGSETLRSHRQVNSLARLTTAIARFDFSEKATMSHVRYAEKILSESLEEKDPGLIVTGKTNAERELEDAYKEQIELYFNNLSTEAKNRTHEIQAIHQSIAESHAGWRGVKIAEALQWAIDVSRKAPTLEYIGDGVFMYRER